MNQFQKSQSARILACYESTNLEKSDFDSLEKGGKRTFIGEVRRYGGQDWVKHQDGWVLVNHASGKHLLELPGGKRVPAEKHHVEHASKHLGSEKKEVDSKSIDQEKQPENKEDKSSSLKQQFQSLGNQFKEAYHNYDYSQSVQSDDGGGYHILKDLLGDTELHEEYKTYRVSQNKTTKLGYDLFKEFVESKPGLQEKIKEAFSKRTKDDLKVMKKMTKEAYKLVPALEKLKIDDSDDSVFFLNSIKGLSNNKASINAKYHYNDKIEDITPEEVDQIKEFIKYKK